MIAYQFNEVELLEKKLVADWPSIRKAKETTADTIKDLKEILKKVSNQIDLPYEDISLIVFGSLARNEYTSGSDIDWTFLVDGRAKPSHLDIMLKFKNEIAKSDKLKEPGREATFGGLAFSHDIINNIGGNEDTNKNTTQRILLLLESKSIANDDIEDNAHNRIIKGILDRYIREDGLAETEEIKVPRFLLNDIVRYWRTMAVDFGHKRRLRQGEGAALRNIKLRMSRKLIYVSGLLACFLCVINKSIIHNKYDHKIIEYLNDLLLLSPLEILSSTILKYDQLNKSAKYVMDSYDKFLEFLDDAEKRKILEQLKPDKAESNELYQELRELCNKFQDGLDGIFLSDKRPDIFELVKHYGVF